MVSTCVLVSREIEKFNVKKHSFITHAPDFFQALDSFDRFRNLELAIGEDRYPDEAAMPTVNTWISEARYIEEPAAFAFLDSLRSVGIRRIREEDRSCPVCQESYGELGDVEAPIARRLPCGHLCCKSCLALWLSPVGDDQKNTCPHCRQALFQTMPSADTVAGIRARSDMVDCILATPRPKPAGAEWDYMASITAIYTNHLLHQAMHQVVKEISATDASRRVREATAAGGSRFSPETPDLVFTDAEVPVLQEMLLRKAMIRLISRQLLTRFMFVDDPEMKRGFIDGSSKLFSTLMVVHRLGGEFELEVERRIDRTIVDDVFHEVD